MSGLNLRPSRPLRGGQAGFETHSLPLKLRPTSRGRHRAYLKYTVSHLHELKGGRESDTAVAGKKTTRWRSYCRHQPGLNESKMSKPRSVVILGAGVVHLNESKMSKPRSANCQRPSPRNFRETPGHDRCVAMIECDREFWRFGCLLSKSSCRRQKIGSNSEV